MHFKLLIKKDLKSLLPGFAMFVAAGIAMLLTCLLAVFSGNGNFAVSAITVFFYVLLAAVVYTAVKGADVLRRNYKDDTYLEKIRSGIKDHREFLILKLLQSLFMQAFLVTEYVLFIAIVLTVGEKKLNTGEGNLDILERLKEGTDSSLGIVNAFLVYLEVLAIACGVTALAFLAFTLCYKCFLREKYAFGASLMTFFSMLWIVWKIFDLMIPNKGTAALIGTVLFGLSASAVLGAVYVICCPNHLKIKKEEN